MTKYYPATKTTPVFTRCSKCYQLYTSEKWCSECDSREIKPGWYQWSLGWIYWACGYGPTKVKKLL